MAKELAQKQGLKINFEIGDALALEKLSQKFDLIYDSHCLHCIVFDEDRRRVLDGVRNSLASSGIFILDTMVLPEKPFDATTHFKPLKFDGDFILWHKTKAKEYRGVVEVDGQYWCAQRRIYPATKVDQEAIAAGFKTVSRQIDLQENEVSMMRLVLAT